MKPIRPAGQTIILVVVTLLTLGIIMVTSASQQVNAREPVNLHRIFFGRTGFYALLATAMLVLGTRMNVRWLCGLPRRRAVVGEAGSGQTLAAGVGERLVGLHATGRRGRTGVERIARAWASTFAWGLRSPAMWLLAAALAGLILVHFEVFGGETKGANRWIRFALGPIALSFQPSELAKWSLILVIAGYVAGQARERLAWFCSGLLPIFAIIGITGVLIIVEDLGTAVLVGSVAGLMLLAGGIRWRHVAAMVGPAAAAVYLAIMAEPYRMQRLVSFRDPYADPQGSGYHMIQSMAAIASGEVTGRGLGYGVHKFGYLPEDTTDFLFAVLCEELGVFGALLVAALYATLIVAGVRIVVRQTDLANRLVGLGVILTVGLQALINMAVVTGLAPTKGIALPLVSSGGTGWLLTAFSLGLLVGLDREEEGIAASSATAGSGATRWGWSAGQGGDIERPHGGQAAGAGR